LPPDADDEVVGETTDLDLVLGPPKKSPEWFFLNPDPSEFWRGNYMLAKDTRSDPPEWHLVSRPMSRLFTQWAHFTLVMYGDLEGNIGLWPVKRKTQDGSKLDTYSASALSIVKENSGRWLALDTRRLQGKYHVTPCTQDPPPPPPQWPAGGIEELLKQAIPPETHFITTPDNPLLLRFLCKRSC
jgi:hypothetical protein